MRLIMFLMASLLALPMLAGTSPKGRKPKQAPVAMVAPPPMGEPDDAEGRAEAEAWKYGGAPSFEFLQFKQEAAHKETRRYPWSFPKAASAQAMTVAQGSTTLLNWSPLGPSLLHGYGPSRADLNSGRPTAILTHPSLPTTLYMAVAGSGVWKCTNADLAASGDWSWTNITDGLPSSSTQGNVSVGDLAMDPADPNTLYLGMGDPVSVAATGFFISHDGGSSWVQGAALGKATSVRQILPLSGNTLLVLSGESQTCVYRSTNGGTSFSNVTLPSTWSGNTKVNFYALAGTASDASHVVVSGVTYDFTASAWVPVWMKSSDGGQTWSDVTVPATFTPTGQTSAHKLNPWAVNVILAPSGKGYALIGDDTTKKFALGMYITSDFGTTWTFQDAPTLWSLSGDGGQITYNRFLTIDPADPNKVFAAANLASYRSLDGGLTWEQLTHWYGGNRVYAHADFHVAAWSKIGPKTLFMGNDGGLAILRDPYRTPVPTTTTGSVPSDPTFLDHTRNKGIQSQLAYTIASTTASTPADAVYRVAMGMQDNSTGVRMDTGTGLANSTSFELFATGDGMGVLFHPLDGAKLIASSYNDSISTTSNLSSAGTGSWVSNTLAGTGTFFTPIVPVRSDASGNSVLSATQAILYKSTDFGTTWAALSMSGTDASQSIRRIAASDTNPLVLAYSCSITGSNMTGYYTSDGGTTWKKFGTFPTNGTAAASSIWGISIGATDQTLYATSTAYNQAASHLWKSLNGGTTWVALDGSPSASNGFPFGLPVQFLRESRANSSTLYAGTDFGLYVSYDSGTSWSRFGTGLPMVQVSDLFEAPDGSFLRVSTYGRGAWEVVLRSGTAPVISSFTATTPTLAAGQSTSLNWSVSGATSLILNPGNLDVTGLTSTTVAPLTTTTYILTATNATGQSAAQAIVTVTGITVTLSPSITHMGTGVALPFTATLINATNPAVQWSSVGGGLSSTSGATVTFTAPATPGSVTLTVTSVQDATRKATLTIQATSLDLDGGGTVDVLDLGLMLQAYTGKGIKGASNYLAAADLDGDGDVDDDDLALFLLRF